MSDLRQFHFLLGLRLRICSREQSLRGLSVELRHLQFLNSLHSLQHQLRCQGWSLHRLPLSLQQLPICQLLSLLSLRLLPQKPRLCDLSGQLPDLFGLDHLRRLQAGFLLQRYEWHYLGLECSSCGTNCAECSVNGCSKCATGYWMSSSGCVVCSGTQCSCSSLSTYAVLYSWEKVLEISLALLAIWVLL